MHTEGFSGQLDVRKRRCEIIPALLREVLLSEDELHIPLQFKFDERLPMVISFFEYYRFLDKLVTTVLMEKLADKILVRVKMPSTVPLPNSLLDVRVGIFYDLDVESDELAVRGVDHLSVDANFKLYSWSAGDNRFAIKWVSPQGVELSSENREKIRTLIEMLPATFSYFNSKHH